MTNAIVLSLREPGEIDPTGTLTGPLRSIRRVRLVAGESAPLTANGVEFTLFVLAGSGSATTATASVPLRYGVSVTVPLDSEVELTAAAEGLEYFLAELTVRGEPMIVTTVDRTSHTLTGDPDGIQWRCLARRGMLHSEAESVDYLSLGPSAVFDVIGREGVESAWFVVNGDGSIREGEVWRPVRAGDLVLAPAGRAVPLVGGETGMDLLWLAVLPSALSEILPVRRPVAS